MLDLIRTMGEPAVFNLVLALLTFLAGWATVLYQKVTGKKRDAIAKETLHSAAETTTKLFLDLLILAVREGTPVGRLDSFFSQGMKYLKGEGAGDSVRRLGASDATLRNILAGAANEKMLELKGKIALDQALAKALVSE